MRVLIVDLQVFQSLAWDRGIGKFTLELLNSVILGMPENGWDEIQGIFSSQVDNTSAMAEVVRRKLRGLHIIKLDLLPDEIGNHKVINHNLRVIDEYLRKTLDADVNLFIDYFVPSPMQGYICAPLPTDHMRVNKIVLVHDLIPLTFHDMYLQSDITRQEYLSRIKDLARADVYVTNSRTTANDLATYLCVDKNRIFSIDGGPVSHSKTLKTFPVSKPFLIMPTGNDLRKNNERAVKAFKQFNAVHDNKYKLVITSYFKDFQIEYLNSLCDDLVFTGNISGAELSYLYTEAEALLFPSEYEGLGLPILEAVEYGKRVACSDIVVFREISATSFTYFNPYSIREIVNALETVTNNPTVNKKDYKRILSEYSWSKTADKFAEAISHNSRMLDPKRLLKVALFSPDSTGSSLAGKSALNNYVEMSRLHDLDYYTGQVLSDEQRINFLPYIVPTKEIKTGMGFNRKLYEGVIFQLDGTDASAEVLFVALSVPGIVVMHNINLSKSWETMVSKKLIDKSRLDIERVIANKINAPANLYLATLLMTQEVIIVFSKHSKKIINDYADKLNRSIEVMVMPIPVAPLVYDNIMTNKSMLYSTVSNLHQAMNTDFKYNQLLSRIKFLLVDMKNNSHIVLEAMRYGVVPVLCHQEMKNLNLRIDECVVIKDQFDIKQIEALLEDKIDTYQEMSLKARDYISKHYNYKDYAKEMKGIITASLAKSPNMRGSDE